MYPVLLKFGTFTFYTQTCFFFLAFLFGLLAAFREARHADIPRDHILDITLWGFLGSFPGARLMFLLLTSEAASLAPASLCAPGILFDGGVSFQGGLASSGLIAYLVTRYHRHPVAAVADALAPALALSMFFLRLGCLFNGCDYGIIADVPWAIPLHGAPRHPIQLYEGIGSLLLFAALSYYNGRPHHQGMTCLLYLCASSLLRVVVDIYRDDPLRLGGMITFPQLLAGGVAITTGLIIFLTILRRHI